MSKHTPGPWTVFSGYSMDEINGPDGKRIGTAETSRTNPEYRREMHANARLIAAAPDLYDAAENALDVLLICCVAGDGVDDRRAILDAQQLLRAAIRKATGEE